MSNNENEKKKPCSYHTFLFPFRWELPATTDRKKFLEELRLRLDKSWWQEPPNAEKARGEEKASLIAAGYETKQERDPLLAKERDQLYATYQYLTGPARRLVFSEERDDARATPAWHFALRPQASKADKEKRKYRIEKSSENRTESFELDVRAIRLNVYNTGVAVLIFELEYYGVKYATDGIGHHFNYEKKEYLLELEKDPEKLLADINKINEHGRRVNLPFIADLPNRLTADRIILELEDNLPFQDDFPSDGRLSLHHVMEPIRALLGLKAKLKPITDDKEKPTDEEYLITPAIDDRMYVVCLYHNDELIKEAQRFCDGKYAYLRDWKCAEDMYKFAFIESGCTCRSQTMIFKLLRQTVYDRWIDWGTIHAATHHSLVCLTTAGAPPLVINPFLTMYTEMAIIALAQRATILALSDQAAAIANDYNPGNGCDEELRGRIARLRDRHIRAENQILLDEVTVQEQGEELFPMIQRGLFINRSDAKLAKQLENLYAIADDSYKRDQEGFETKIKIFALILAALALPVFFEALGFSLAARWLMTLVAGAGLWLWFVNDKGRKCQRWWCRWRAAIGKKGRGDGQPS